MLKRVAIANFRGIKALDAEVGAVTAFLGPNSSGKTTVLQAVRVAIEGLTIALASERAARPVTRGAETWIEIRQGLVDPSQLMTLADWQALFTNQEAGNNKSFTLKLVFEPTDRIQQISVKVTVAANEKLKLDVSVLAPEATNSVQHLSAAWGAINQVLRPWLFDHAPIAVLVPPFYGTVPNEELRSRVVVDRLLGSADQSHVVRNLVAGVEPEWFERLNNFLGRTIDARLTYRTSGDALQRESPLRVLFKDRNGPIEISAAGAGLVNLIAIYAALSRWRQSAQSRPVMFLLDEPEAHLHPKLQAQVTAEVASLVREFGAQLLLATHSIDILNQLSHDGATLIRCNRNATPSAIVLESDAALFDDLGGWTDLTPYTAINLLASRKVLFCEGPSDRDALSALAALRFRNDPDRLKRFKQWSPVLLEGASNERLAELVARLIRSDSVRAQARQGAFHVITVLDRDYSRTPGVTEEPVDGVSATRWVWSRHSIESLLLDAAVLTPWLRAALPADSTPPDLEQIVATANAAADADPVLNRDAGDALASVLARGEVRDPKGVLVTEFTQRMNHALRIAREMVDAEPATWQRGKDRSAFVLREVAKHLPRNIAGHFPSNVLRVIQTADVKQVSDITRAIPPEIRDLLDRMVKT